jgi:hypothetical protein
MIRRGPQMLRYAALSLILLLTLALAACGSSATITFKQSLGNGSYTVVATGDPSTIAAEKAGLPAGSVTNGDTHTGNEICQTDVNDSGRTFHIILYSTTSVPAAICNSLAEGINS